MSSWFGNQKVVNCTCCNEVTENIRTLRCNKCELEARNVYNKNQREKFDEMVSLIPDDIEMIKRLIALQYWTREAADNIEKFKETLNVIKK